MFSEWSKKEFTQMKSHNFFQGVNEDVALCVYGTRLIGRNPDLVLHGGGNTSVKTIREDLYGNAETVLCVKGSGWDMAEILPAGLPPVRLSPLQKLKSLESLSDEEMVNCVRSNLLDSTSPTPSVETLSHAFLPHKFINHSHAAAILSVTNQENAEEICYEIFGKKMGIVPYIMPGFELAKRTLEVFNQDSDVDGLILLNHGIFTFADEAKTSYECMIDAISAAEKTLANSGKKVFEAVSATPQLKNLSSLAPIIRGVCVSQDEQINTGGIYSRNKFILEFRTTDLILEFVNGKELERYSQAGVATPDHVIRTKNHPLILNLPTVNESENYLLRTKKLVEAFQEKYDSYFHRQVESKGLEKTKLDSIPRVVLVPGLGLFGVGRTHKESVIAADIAESFINTVRGAESIGRYKSLNESDVFDVEYWSLEQAKLSSSDNQPLLGNVVAITGGGGTIGNAIADEFSKLGAEVAVLDLDFAEDKGSYFQLICDVTDPANVKKAFERICKHFGGLDIVISNAGAMYQGTMEDVSDETLRKSFEVNFFSHQTVMQNAVKIMKLQGLGGSLLLNVSKQAVNPGAEAGPYGIAKAATLALMRQYAIEVGKYGIRVNAVNPDRIQSGLLTKEIIRSRASARGVDAAEYLTENILGREVTAQDVAMAFTHLALSQSTVANVATVDGGNIAAALR
jgi:rhamnose utilization protein RhaD (predicted bifunctional aldolase and dehydrogenase)/NAD(P)-dependent dehydrogenase (short-subunit alcohol dehydrogenase family)|tara:strand:+ start:872 stop:2923 length:2052 start_codon:yes stop_codon:yes gene_type:complete